MSPMAMAVADDGARRQHERARAFVLRAFSVTSWKKMRFLYARSISRLRDKKALQ